MDKNLIIIPTYNEKNNIGQVIKKIFEFVPGADILVVDDNSPDGTGKTIENLRSQYHNLSLLKREKKEGLGKAYIAAFKTVLEDRNFKTITMMDGDLSHDPRYLPEMLKLAKNYDLVIGSRYIDKGGVTKKWGIWRRFLSATGNLYLRLIFRRYTIRDWTTGYNVIKLSALEKINFDLLSPRGYAFISSLKYYLAKSGATIKESPIFFEERNGGESKMSFGIILEGLMTPWKIMFKNLFS